MRYFALRLLSLFYMLLSIVVFIFSIIVFSVIEINAAQFIAAVGLHGSWRAAATLLAFGWLVGGIIISLFLFAGGQFINLMIDIANGVNNIEWWFNQRGFDIRSGDSPLAPHAPRYEPPSKGRSY